MNPYCFNNKMFSLPVQQYTKMGGPGKKLSKHIKNLFRTSKQFSKCTKINKLGNSGCLFDGFWPGPPIYVYYLGRAALQEHFEKQTSYF